MTTRDQIAHWFDEGVKIGATHMLVVCDTFDYDDFPVYVMPTGDSLEEVKKRYGGINMSRIMETYNLSEDKEEQVNS